MYVCMYVYVWVRTFFLDLVGDPMGRPRFFFLDSSFRFMSFESVTCVRGMGGRAGGTV